MRTTTSRAALALIVLAVLTGAGWLIGMQAARHMPEGTAYAFRADYPPDMGTSRPGPTDPNGPSY